MFMVFSPAKISKHVLVTIAAACMACVLIGATVHAFSRGYKTSDTAAQAGMVVSLVRDDSGSQMVERASRETQDSIVGVIVTPSNTPITFSSQENDILVETEGEISAYVSDVGGVVKKGDLLSISPVKGVLMKTPDSGRNIIVGIATQDMGDMAELYTIDDNGRSRDTKIGKVKVSLNRLGTATQGDDGDETLLERLGRAITGKPVNPIRVFLALLLFVIVLVTGGTIIYGAVSNGVIALGRNPMARKAIQRQLAQISVVATIVLLVGLAAVYALLWI